MGNGAIVAANALAKATIEQLELYCQELRAVSGSVGTCPKKLTKTSLPGGVNAVSPTPEVASSSPTSQLYVNNNERETSLTLACGSGEGSYAPCGNPVLSADSGESDFIGTYEDDLAQAKVVALQSVEKTQEKGFAAGQAVATSMLTTSSDGGGEPFRSDEQLGCQQSSTSEIDLFWRQAIEAKLVSSFYQTNKTRIFRSKLFI